jgi:hypothetical protein
MSPNDPVTRPSPGAGRGPLDQRRRQQEVLVAVGGVALERREEHAGGRAALLVDGLADAASRPVVRQTTAPSTRPGLPGLVDRVRWLVRGTPPPAATPAKGTTAGTPATAGTLASSAPGPISATASVRSLRRDTA